MENFLRAMVLIVVAIMFFLIYKTHRKPSLFWKKWGWSLIVADIIVSIPLYFKGAGVNEFSILYMALLVLSFGGFAFINYFKYKKGDVMEEPKVKNKKSKKTILEIVAIIIGSLLGSYINSKANGVDFIQRLTSWGIPDESIWEMGETGLCMCAGAFIAFAVYDYIKRTIKNSDGKNEKENSKPS
jgi:hypothetical protein